MRTGEGVWFEVICEERKLVYCTEPIPFSTLLLLKCFCVPRPVENRRHSIHLYAVRETDTQTALPWSRNPWGEQGRWGLLSFDANWELVGTVLEKGDNSLRQQSSLAACLVTQQEGGHLEASPGRELSPETKPCWNLGLNFPDSRMMRNKCLLLTPPSQSLALGLAAWADEDKSLDGIRRSLDVCTLLSVICVQLNSPSLNEGSCSIYFLNIHSFILSADFF